MGHMAWLRCPFCGETMQTLIRSKRVKKCPYCKRKFFYYRKAYFIRLDDIQFLQQRTRDKIVLLLDKR